ncbi:hypothetical protein PINS_up000821 [Pythium insidiosum]|nr:hypothetical protein PINS_up000821 [Pythium insidiosum]
MPSTPADAYGKTVGGRLTLKGGIALSSSKKKKKSKKSKDKKSRKHDDDADSSGNSDGEDAATASSGSKKRSRGGADAPAFELVKRQGSGRILSSGTTVMGQPGTRFLQELAVGDALIIQHPKTLTEETRIVRMVLSDVSCAISSAFSSDLVSSTPFQYIKAPPEEEDKEALESKKKRKRQADEAAAFGTYAGGTEAGTTYSYRVKKSGTYGGYAIVTERAQESRSREELLDMRSKRKGDRHCM